MLAVPLLIHSYRKYNGVYLRNSFVVATFVIYLCCAYALIIFPLPSFEQAMSLKTELYSFQPFRFIQTFLASTPFNLHDSGTWAVAFRHHSFLEPFFNFLLLMPLGLYLTGFFRKKLWVAVLIAFGVSLFFELSQLTGLYGIYPRPYRLFDVDDLITNTSGAFVGACIGLLVAKFSSIFYARKPVATGQMSCSFMRRLLAFGVDFVIIFVLEVLVRLVIGLPLSVPESAHIAIHVGVYLLEGGIMFLYFWLFSVLLKGQTPGKKLLKMRLVAGDGTPASKSQLAAHYGLVIGLISLYTLLALSFVLPVTSSPLSQSLLMLGWLGLGGLILVLTLLFRKNRRCWFDRLSHTCCTSTFEYVPTEKAPDAKAA